jgi:hypothetical protein
VWAYLRDFLEATSQRWERHVVGYDFNQQMGLLQVLTSRRGGTSILGAKWSRPRHYAPFLGVAVGVGAVVAYVYLRRRRQRKRGDAPEGPARSPSALLATELYERLDAAMTQKGIPRAPGIPPLRHAEALAALAHPLAEEIYELTDVYLRARFGGEVITEEARRSFEERVRGIRTAQLPPALAA